MMNVQAVQTSLFFLVANSTPEQGNLTDLQDQALQPEDLQTQPFLPTHP
jgi:hypothetical protein